MSYNLRCIRHRRTASGDILATVALMEDESQMERFTDKLNLTSSKRRLEFARELLKRFPDLKGRDIEGQLLELLRKVPADEGKDGMERVPQAQILVSLAREAGHEFFHDGQTPFVAVERDGHREIWPVRSRSYRQWLGKVYWEAQDGKVPNLDAVGAAINVLEGLAVHGGPACSLNNRVAWYNSELWYDLTDSAWRAVRITPQGWGIVDKPPILFQRHAHQLPQVTPASGGDPRAILKFLRPNNDGEGILWLAYICSCFIPDIPHPIPIIYGDPGSGKSTKLHLASLIVDPSILPKRSLPRDQNALVQSLSHQWMNIFDNVGRLPDWLSDAFCRAVTGEGDTKRELYSTDEDFIYHYRRCIGLNGINISADRADLLDRSILFESKRIPESALVGDSELLTSFRSEQSAILGGFLDTLSRALAVKREGIQLPWRPRMLDFAYWGCATSRALGYSEFQFLEAYQANVREQNVTALAGSQVATAILEFMNDQESWTGTPAELLTALEGTASNLKINTKGKGWPQSPTWLGRLINEVRVNLDAVGISVERIGSHRDISIRRVVRNSVASGVRAEPSTPSSVTPIPRDSVVLALSDKNSVTPECIPQAIPERNAIIVSTAKTTPNAENSITRNPEAEGRHNNANNAISAIFSEGGRGENQSQTQKLGTTPPYPSNRCPCCGCPDYWLRNAGLWDIPEWLCSVCHPKLEGNGLC